MIQKLNIPISNKQLTSKDNKNQNFKGAGTALLTGLRGLNNSPAIGACAVDLCSMVIPRTVIEAKNRGKQAGIEAAFREGASCLIHACVGLIGLGAATLISGKFNKDYGIKAQNIFASGDTIKNMSAMWQKADGNADKFFSDFVSNISGLDGKRWRGVSTKAKAEITSNLVKLAEKSNEIATKTGAEKRALSKEVSQLKNLVVGQITKNTGAQASFRLNSIKDASGNVLHKGVSSSLSELVDNAVGLSNSFKTKSVSELPNFVKALTKNKVAGTLLGLGICAAMCMSVQPLNRYLTKKRTGQDGFVGVDNKQGDNSAGFKTAKTAAGIAFPLFAIKTIGNPKNIISNVQFNSKVPTINQFKLLYGLTIGSRFLSARDGNELRESVIKDTLGFTNWLILGGIVSKLTARAIGGKDLINNPVTSENGKKGLKYLGNWITKASVKSYDEVLLPKAKQIAKDGKVLKFSQLFKNADSATKSKVAKIAFSQVAGYLYSGIVLGVGIAKLNIFITRKLQAKKQAATQDVAQQPLKPKGKANYVYTLKTKNSSVFKDFQ